MTTLPAGPSDQPGRVSPIRNTTTARTIGHRKDSGKCEAVLSPGPHQSTSSDGSYRMFALRLSRSSSVLKLEKLAAVL